jgi:hypothetical protein
MKLVEPKEAPVEKPDKDMFDPKNFIVAAWKMGVRHWVRLANIAIKAVEGKTEPFSDDQKRG